MAGNIYDMFYGFANSAASQFESRRQNTSVPFDNWTQQNNVVRPPTTHNYKMAPPASKKAIKNLAVVQVTSDDLIEESNKECLICLNEQTIGSTACKLACGHLYHQACLTEWLEKSCTCKQNLFIFETLISSVNAGLSPFVQLLVKFNMKSQTDKENKQYCKIYYRSRLPLRARNG